MRIGLQRERSFAVDVDKIVLLLSSVCQHLEFKRLPDKSAVSSNHFVSFEDERDHLDGSLRKSGADLILYVTKRGYRDNYFLRGTDDALVLSMAYWEHYTPLPEENGILFFIARAIADHLLPEHYHYQSTGCLYDFLGIKTDVDSCMRLGVMCEKCSADMDEAIGGNEDRRVILDDLKRILDLVANTSRWSKSVFYGLEDRNISEMSPITFESLVSDHYRSLGAEVQRNVTISGFKADMLVTEITLSGERIRSAIECKFYENKVGSRTVTDFARLIATMRETGGVERGTIVAYSGFDKGARLAAKTAGIRLLDFKDIKEKAADDIRSEYVNLSHRDRSHPTEKALPNTKKEVFVIMPFSTDLDDVFYYGIHGAVLRAGAVCKRADQVEFTGGVLEEIYRLIRSANFVVAEVTNPNPNVFYELGYAHALDKPVILITKSVENAPFDVSGFNHIVYSSIQELERRLTQRLDALIR